MEYEIYRAVIASAGVDNDEAALQAVAKQYGITAAEVRGATEKVQGILVNNNWFGSRESELRRASDYKGP
jgi:hypothetical protein